MARHSRSKKRNKRRRRLQKAVICLILLLLIALAALLLVKTVDFLFASTQPSLEKRQLLTELHGVSADTELVTVEAKENRALISCITPGLDTASMRVIAYDLAAKKPLSETALGADDWKIGLTDNGFYAVSVSKKTVYLYGNDGLLRATKPFADTPAWSSVCEISADEKWLLHAVLPDGALYLRALDGETVTTVSHAYPDIEVLGFENGQFYLKSNIGDLFILSPTDSALKTVWSDRRCTTVTPYYGMGTANDGFLLTTADKTAQISLHTAEETLVGNGKTGFATVGAGAKSLYVYDLSTHFVSEVQTAAPVESACFLSNGRLLLVTGDPAAQKHSLFLCDPSLAVQSSFTVTEKSRATEMSNAAEQTKPAYSSKIISGVPLIHQFPAFPTGCESVSAVMLMQNAGASITVDSFVDNYLEKSTAFYSKDGKAYGPDPYQYFLGSPRSTASYGCMAPVIEKAMLQYYDSLDKVVNATGTSLPALCGRYIDHDQPVMVWVSIKMLSVYPSASWYLENGQQYSWPANEHCMVLIGYDQSSYYFNDPYTGKQVKYSKAVSEDRYDALGKQALVVLKSP